MRPVNISLQGNYFDSFIYEGRLYLFKLDGTILTVDWDRLVSTFSSNQILQIALLCAFKRSDYLYSSDARELLTDIEIKDLMKNKFNILAQHHIEIDEAELARYAIDIQENRNPFPHSDIEIYKHNLYTGSREGMTRATCDKSTKYPISSKPQKLWDAPVLGLSASYNSMAIAAGSEGLFEYPLSDRASMFVRNSNLLSPIYSSGCNWAYYNIYGSSKNSGILARFQLEAQRTKYEVRTKIFREIETAEEIFHSSGYSWGVQDKLCQVNGRNLKIVKFKPWEQERLEALKLIKNIEFDLWKGDVISGGIASFGIVVELQNAMVIIPSGGDPITIPGEPVNWKIFPRSKHYENQLHIVYEGRIVIQSYNHDYLVDQETKEYGISYSYGSWRLRGRHAS